VFNILPSSEAVRSGDLVFFGGTVGRDANGTIKPLDAAGQTELILRRFQAYLEAEGLGLQNLVTVFVYMPDLRYFNAVNEVYARIIPSPLPPRKLIVTPLVVEGAVVEMTAIASAQPRRVLPRPGKDLFRQEQT
jgi:2-iminobutanoate/2-iminopropanoate deaminase